MDSNTKNYKAFLFNIAGVQFHQYKDALATEALETGATLDVIPEPENPYDTTAVALYWNGYKLGYIPNKGYNQSAECKETIEKSGVDKCRCILSKLDIDETTYRMFNVLLEVEV